MTQAGLLLTVLGFLAAVVMHFDNKNDTSESAAKGKPEASVTSSPQEKVDNTRGWGPERKTFLHESPAPYPALNSVTNNPVHGDERNFVQCKEKDKGNEFYADSLVAHDDTVYRCYAWFSNAAAPDLDERVVDGRILSNPAAYLHNTRFRAVVPREVRYNQSISGILTADNSMTVWSSCTFTSPHKIQFGYVRGSSEMHAEGTPDGGLAMMEKYEEGVMVNGIRSPTGAPLGFDKQDGFVGQGGGFVLFDVRVDLHT